MAEEVSLSILVGDLLRRWKLASAVALAVFAGAFFYAESLPSRYTASVVVAFAPKPTSTVGGDTVRVLLPKYVAYLSSRATANRVAQRTGEKPGVLVDSVEASVATDSANLTIKVTLPSSPRAASAANSLADETLSFANSDQLLDGVLVAPALPGFVPSGPPRRLLELAALIVGVLGGAAIALMLERGRPRLRTWKEIGVVTGYVVVGRIPLSRSLRGSSVEALSDPAVGAAIRTLRTNLERASREHPVSALVVTSSLPGEGRTTVAGALAVTLARLEANVLLIDGDLRRPAVGRRFALEAEPGLANVLKSEAYLEDCIRPGPVQGLSILPTPADKDAGDLLARGFPEVLQEARQRFDVIVVDVPPILGGDDARTVATQCDGVLMIVAVDTLAQSVTEASSALDTLGVRVLGIVANRVRESEGLGSYGAYGLYGGDTAS